MKNMKCWKIPKKRIPKSRYGHHMVPYKNCALMWGGYIHGTYSREEKYLPAGETWVYHSDTEQWVHVINNCGHPPGTSGACAVILNGGLYIVCGYTGQFGNVNTVWRMDLVVKSWEEVQTKEDTLKPSPRDKFVAWVYQNKIYCFGGYGYTLSGYLHEHGDFYLDEEMSGGVPEPGRYWNNQLIVFDPVEQSWSNPKCHGDVPSPRAAHAADRMKTNNKVYLFGGRHNQQRMSDLYSLDLSTLKWKRLYPESIQPCGRSWHSFTAIPPQYMFLFGGYTQDRKPLADSWVLDINTLQWTEVVSPSAKPRLWHTATLTCDQEVLIFGGCCSDILDQEEDAQHTNELVIFRIAPKSLKRLCLDAAFKYRKKLKAQWDILPKNLSEVLKMRLKGISCEMLNSTQYQAQSQGRSCTIS